MSSLREALESAMTEAETVETVKTDVVETVETPEPTESTTKTVETVKSDKPRDDSGKFAKQTPVEPVEPTEPVEAAPVRKAPSSWKPAAQEAFLKADRGETLTADEIKLLTAEAERREADFHKGVSEFKTHSERARAYDQAIAPFQGHLQKLGVDAPTAITALMRADYTLRNSDPQTKAAYFAQLAGQYGIDLSNLTNPPQVDPQTQYLMNQLNELRQNQQIWQNQQQQQEQMRAQQELQSFGAADKPHFDAVRGDMADLLESGKAKSLSEAYDMAVWMRPDIRQSLLDQKQAEAQRKAMEQLSAQRAKTAAAVSVKGSSPSSGGVLPSNKGSLRDIIAAQLE